MSKNIITVSVSRIQNLGDYENVKIEFGYTKEIDESSDYKEEIEKAYKNLSKMIEKKLKKDYQ